MSLICLITAMFTGCSSTSSTNQRADKPKPHRSGTQIKLGGDGLNLGETEHAILRPEKLVSIVNQLLGEQRYQSARHWVLRYPDVALELLRNTSPRDAGNPSVRFIAEAHDEQCNPTAPAGWRHLLAAQSSGAAAHNAFQQRRGQVLAAIRAGRLSEAATIDLAGAVPSSSPGSMLEIEALRLHGIAMLLNEEHTDAAGAFEKAAALAGDAAPFQAAHLHLLAADARRRAGDGERADEHWRQAVARAGALLDRAAPVEAPVLWERAAYLHPQNEPWPTELADTLTRSLADHRTRVWQSDAFTTRGSGDANAIEMLIWSNVGVWRLARQEAQSALVALQRAEVLSRNDALRDELRLHQARALSQLGQHTAAMSVLVGLMTKRTPVGRSALAVAGVMSIEQGQVQRGLSLLKRAVDAAPGDVAAAWPGRAQAEADLGLAYLIVGDEQRGFDTLHRAQQSLDRQHTELLIKSLRNEMRYLEATDNEARGELVSRRLSALERLDS